MSFDLKSKTIQELRHSLSEGDFSSQELIAWYLAEIKKKDRDLNAYIEVFDDAENQALEADKRIKQGDSTPLLGIPLALKDNILVEGKKISAGSKILEGYTASYDATVVTLLRKAGAVFIGRTNMDEFAMGSSTEHSAYKVTKNPYDATRVPGGSSGGSAAAVSLNLAVAALGSDTGGSIRQPASFCGCVGLKPTYGSVSRSGLIALGSSLDQIGPLTRSVGDAEIIFNTIRGKDKLDSTSYAVKKSSNTAKKKSYTIGIPRAFLSEGVDSDVLENFETLLAKLEEQGHTIVDIELPYVRYSLCAYYIIMPAEASTNLARFDGIRYGLHKEGSTLIKDYQRSRGAGFGEEVRRRILLGTYVLSSGYYDAYYSQANAVRVEITEDFRKAFESVDLIATPTTPTPAFKIGEKSDPVSMYLADIFTVPANITGMPGLSIPTGEVSREGTSLPVGFQLLAPHQAEHHLFALGKDVESIQA